MPPTPPPHQAAESPAPPEADRADKTVPRKRGVTIVEVAREAGVGQMTVSRYFSDPERVAPKTRSRIRKVVERLGYSPSPAARMLASKRSDIVGVIIPSVTNLVFADVLKGLYEESAATPLQIQIANARYDPAAEEQLIRNYLLQGPAGLIVTGAGQTPASRELLGSANCPVVQIMEIAPDPVDMMVGLDHGAAAAAAVRHLLAQGYQRPAFLAGQQDPRVMRRLAAFRAEAMRHGAFCESRVLQTPEPSSSRLGQQLMARLLDEASGADCVFCNNDDIALGALFECQRRGVDVPGAMGLCGYNDFEGAAITHPTLTSIRTNRYEMGRIAMQMLLATSAGLEPEARVVDLGFEVVVRQSTQRTAPRAG